MAETEEPSAGDSALAVLKRLYHVPVLAGLLSFMFWTRYQNADAFSTDGGVQLQAVDSWYHWRATNWMVENFPQTLTFDPWTGFPEGATPGQFGTLFDQIVVAVAMLIGLGDPSSSDVLTAALVTVPLLGALVAVPVYYIGKRTGTRIGGLVGAAVLALFAGEFFARSTAGQFQHHAAEALFMALSVLAVIVALTVAERDRPVWELVRRGDWPALRRSTIYSALAGVVITLYLYVWPPGVVFVGILGLYFVAQLSIDYYRGRPADHLAFVGVVSMLVVAAGTAAAINRPGFSATGLDFFQPVLALLVAGGCVFMTVLARVWDANKIDRRGYPVAVGVSILGALAVLAVGVPSVFETLVNNLSGRIVPFGRSDSALTVAEVDPPGNLVSFFGDEYGWALWSGLLALPILAVQALLRDEERGRYLFVLVWAVVLISMGMTQVRFNYYTAVAVAVLNAHLVGFLTAGMELPGSVDEFDERVSGVQVYQVVAVLFVVLVVFVPLLPPVASQTPASLGDETGPSPDGVTWESTNNWLAENTPAVGNYGGAGNADELSYTGQYDWPSNGSFEYPEGAYGVLSWWDYGHLITVQGERIPHANPFQQNARSASAFLTAQNESQAELYLDAIAAGESPTHESNESDLREAVEESDTGPGIQYVMIDDESAAEKFPAITAWTGPGYGEYITQDERNFIRGRGENRDTVTREVRVGEDYYDTMLARLYLEDAEGLEHFRLVRESPRYSAVGFYGNIQASQSVGTWEDVTEQPGENESSLADTIESFTQARTGDFGVPIGFGQTIHDPYVASKVKVFERVDGATLTGETTAGDTVRASVTLETATNRTFEYTQSTNVTDGNFEMTVPYPTDETLMPEDGYANSSISAVGGYNVTVLNGTETEAEAVDVTVPEEDVQTGGAVPVELEAVLDPPQSNLTNLDIAGQADSAIITVGAEASITVDVTNEGEAPGEFSTALEVGNQTATEAVEELAAGETATVTFDGVLSELDPNQYPVTVNTNNDSESGVVVVQEPPAPAESNVSDLDIAGQGVNATVTAGETGNVSVTVGNLGDLAGAFDVTLGIDDTVERTQSTAELDGNTSATVTFENVTAELDAGTYNVTASTGDDNVTGALTVETPTAVAAARAV